MKWNYFEFIKEISIDDYNLIFEGTEYDWETLAVYTKYWIEAQKKIKINEGTFAFFKTHNARIKLKGNYYTNELTTLGFIYISRDPRDIVLSYSKHTNKDIDSTIDLLINDKIMGGKKVFAPHSHHQNYFGIQNRCVLQKRPIKFRRPSAGR